MRTYRFITLFTLLLVFQTQKSMSQKWITVQNSDSIDVTTVKQVYIHSLRGVNLSVTGNTDNALNYTVFIQANESAMLRNFGGGRLYSKQDGELLELYFNSSETEERSSGEMTWIKSLFSGKGSHVNNETKEARLTITLPKEIQIRVNSKYSNIKLIDLNGKAEISNRSGSVTAKNLMQGIDVSNNYGNHELSNIKGDIQINSRSGNSELEEIQGNVTIDSDYSEMNISNVNGTLKVKNKSGSLRAEHIKGALEFDGNYSKVTLKHISGSVSMQNKSGTVNMEDIGGFRFEGDYTNINASQILGNSPIDVFSKSANLSFKAVSGPLNINADYMTIDLEEMSSDVKINGKSSTVNARDIKGNLDLTGDYSKFNINKFHGVQVEAVTRSGSIDLECTSNLLNKVSIRNSNGSVKIELNPVLIGSGRIKADGGSIDFSLSKDYIKREIQNSDLKEMELTGSGKLELMVTNSNGTIQIK